MIYSEYPLDRGDSEGHVQTEGVEAFIGLGSNLGDGKNVLQEAWGALGDIDGIICEKLSSPYMTAPVDMNSQHWFTNAVGRLRVTVSPMQLLKHLMEIEATFGRVRESSGFGYQDRTLDLDVLYFTDVVMDKPELVLPHPRIGDRLFVLVPICEINPEFADTISGRTVTQMKTDLTNSLEKTTRKKQEIVKGSWT